MRTTLNILLVVLWVAIVACSTEGNREQKKIQSSAKLEEKKQVSKSVAGLNQEPSLELLPEDRAGNIIKNAISLSGGWNLYKEKQTFSFYKVIQHFDSLGRMQREVKQHHQYRLKPHFHGRISWKMDNHEYLIINTGQQSRKFKDGQILTADKDNNEAWNTSFGSHYVMFMPFKLADPGAILNYKGIDTLAHGQVVHSVHVNYEQGAGSSARFHDWHYYFDTDGGELIGNFLDYGKGKSYTEYQTWQEVEGIRLGKKRSVFGVSIDGEIGYKKTVYINEEMEFDLEMPDELFSLPEVR